MDSFATLLETARDMTASDIFDVVFHSSYYPFFFILQCARVCAQIRRSTPCLGLQWWRSFALGFAITYAPRLFFGWLIGRKLPEATVSLVAQYATVWALFNLTPFDIVTRFFNRIVPRVLLILFAELGLGQQVVHYMWSVTHVYTGRPMTCLTVYATAMALAVVIDAFDNSLFAARRRWPCASLGYWKRLVAAAGIVILLCEPNALVDFRIYDMYYAIPVAGCAFVVLKIIDLALFPDESEIVDVIFPEEVAEIFFTFHAKKC